MDLQVMNVNNFKLLVYVSRVIHPKYHPYWFLFYMYVEFDRIVKRSLKYNLKVVNQRVVLNVFKNSLSFSCDLNNSVIVHDKNVYKSDNILKLRSNCGASRLVFILTSPLVDKNEILLGDTFFYNLSSFDKNSQFQLWDVCEKNVNYASEIDLSLISSPTEISNSTIDAILGNYFTLPKLIYSGDLIEINVKYFGGKVFYTNNKINNVESIYFKCNKVIFNEKGVDGGYLCVIGETTIKQSVNIQSFLPPVFNCVVKNEIKEIPLCPYGLQEVLRKMEKSVKPFLRKKKLNLKPIFLIQGEVGCGMEILISTLASQLGMHFYRISNSDLMANVYAQNEIKLRNAFFNGKMAAPCMISLHNFQNFGKNNEGQFDERIMNNFSKELDILLDNNPFPIIVFCCSSEKNIPSDLKRLFLETFEINAPTDIERVENLKWILEMENISTSVDLSDIANKTHGFFFEDLKALVYYAKLDQKQKQLLEDKKIESNFVVNEDHFLTAVDHMHSNYNKSLGAPKVPKVEWSDVGGLTGVKDEIIKTINLPLKHPEFLKTSGLKRTGILLFGPPGTGKTLIAKAVATECNLCFLSVKGPELLNMYVGQSEQNVREVFEKARQASPCIIFFDELDSLAPNRGMNGDSGGVMDRVVSQLLAEMDGLNDSATVFIIGATNRPDLIDPALLRPGRFDKLLYIGPCTDVESKISVLKALTRKFSLAKDVNLQEIVKNCPANITGADFYGICSNAWTNAVRKIINNIESGDGELLSHEKVVVDSDDFANAVKNVKPSISPDDLRYFEKLKKELASNV